MAVHQETPIREKILSVLVENRAGVLARVVGLFSARGFNIDSLAVGETADPTASRITLVTRGDEKTLEQIKKQLNRLIDVIKIQDLSQEGCIDRELMLVKLEASAAVKKKLASFSKQYQMVIVRESDGVITVECTENRQKRSKLFEELKSLGILEIAQTGAVALSTKGIRKTKKDSKA